MSTVTYEDYVENLTRRQKQMFQKVVPDSYDTVFEQYELDVPCYENDTSLPELVSASVRPISEFYQIPDNSESVCYMPTSEDSAERPIRFVTETKAPKTAADWPSVDPYELNESDDYLHSLYRDHSDADYETTGFSSGCVYEEHYVFDVFEQKASNDDDWTGPIITEVTDSGDEEEKVPKEPKKPEETKVKESPIVENKKQPVKVDTCVTVANNAGVLTGPAKDPLTETISNGAFADKSNGRKDCLIDNIIKSVAVEEKRLEKWPQQDNLAAATQLLLKAAPVERIVPPLHQIPFKENVPTNKINLTPGYSVSTIFAINENLPPITPGIYNKAMVQPVLTTQRSIQITDPYGDGILTAISDHNRLIDQFPSMYRQTDLRASKMSPLLERRQLAAERKIREQQNRYRMLRGTGLGPSYIRHTGMQNTEMWPPQNEYMTRGRNFYRAPGESFFAERPRRNVPYGQPPFNKVNVTVSARSHVGRVGIDETTEVLEKLNDIYHYVLTKPTVGPVKTKIEEVHHSVRSGGMDDFLSSRNGFVNAGQPIHLGHPPIQTFGPNGIRNVKIVPTATTSRHDACPKQHILDFRYYGKGANINRPCKRNEKCFEF